MSRASSLALAAVLAASLLLAGCIKLPSSSDGGDSSSGGSDDFSWRGNAGLPGSKVPVSTPRLQVLLGDPSASGLSSWTPPFDSMPKNFDLDGDGHDEIIALGNDTNVYVFSVQDGTVLAKLPITVRSDWYIERVLNGVEAGILRQGEPASIVVAGPAAHIAVWQYAGTADGQFQFTKTWERRLNQCNPQPSMDAKPVLADLDGDGTTLEILAQTEEVGVFAFKADGSSLWRQCWAGGNAAPLAADLDGDGRLEAVFASDDGYLSVLDGAKGSVKWTFDTKEVGVTPASISTSPTVAELDGKSPKELVFTARNAPSSNPADFDQNHMAIVAVHASEATGWEGKALWVVKPDWANPLAYAHLVAHDVDEDGEDEIFGMDWNTIGHNPGNWERLGDAHVFRLESDGSDGWVRNLDTWWSNKDIVLGDANGDGELDVLANGPYVGNDGFWVLSAKTGEPSAFLPAGGWKVLRGAQLLDLHHDGTPELVLPVEPVDPADRRGAILVVDLGVKALGGTGPA